MQQPENEQPPNAKPKKKVRKRTLESAKKARTKAKKKATRKPLKKAGRKPAPKPHRKGKSAPRTVCVACGTVAPELGELVRIVQLDSLGWVPDERKRLTGPSLDIHCSAVCLDKLAESSPTPPIDSEQLESTLRTWLEAGVLDALSRVAAAGQLVGGHDVLQDAFTRGEVHSVLVASDAASRTLRSLQRGAPEGIAFHVVAVDNEALASRVGRATLAAAGIPDTPAAAPLLRRLAMLKALNRRKETP